MGSLISVKDIKSQRFSYLFMHYGIQKTLIIYFFLFCIFTLTSLIEQSVGSIPKNSVPLTNLFFYLQIYFNTIHHNIQFISKNERITNQGFYFKFFRINCFLFSFMPELYYLLGLQINRAESWAIIFEVIIIIIFMLNISKIY